MLVCVRSNSVRIFCLHFGSRTRSLLIASGDTNIDLYFLSEWHALRTLLSNFHWNLTVSEWSRGTHNLTVKMCNWVQITVSWTKLGAIRCKPLKQHICFCLTHSMGRLIACWVVVVGFHAFQFEYFVCIPRLNAITAHYKRKSEHTIMFFVKVAIIGPFHIYFVLRLDCTQVLARWTWF